MRKEVISGYTTIPFRFDYVDFWDPRSGVLLRLADNDLPPRKMTFNFRQARQSAETFAVGDTLDFDVSQDSGLVVVVCQCRSGDWYCGHVPLCGGVSQHRVCQLFWFRRRSVRGESPPRR